MSGIRAARKRETRRAILEAAIRLFSEKGFDATSVEDLAREAGVGKGTIYGYFQTKDEIFLAFCEEELDVAFAALETPSASAAPLLERLLAFFMSQFRFVTQNREFGRHLIREVAFPRAATSGKSREMDSRYLEVIQQLLGQAQDRGEVRNDYDPFLGAVHFYALYLVALSGWFTGYVSDHAEVEISLRQLFRQALDGLGKAELKG